MSDFFNWLSNNSTAATTLIVAFGIVVASITLIYVVSFFQGRDVAFWPPKIGAKPNKNKISSSKTDKVPNMEGYWLQEMEKFNDRPYSIGNLNYDKNLQEYTFDGTNYYADGSVVCEWKSIHVHVDLNSRMISYIFRASMKGELHSLSYGFGIMNLSDDESGELLPIDGHFIDSQVNASPQSFNVRRLDEIEKISKVKKSGDMRLYYSALIREYNTSHHK